MNDIVTYSGPDGEAVINLSQGLDKNAIFSLSKHDCIVRNMHLKKQCIYIIRNTGSHILDFPSFEKC